MIEHLRALLVANRFIVLSFYGQVFFVLGLAVAFQSSRRSRLALARSLKWLAAFGLTQGFHAWGHVFIPVQAEYMTGRVIELLIAAQAYSLAISFTCLFTFGVETMRPLPSRQRWLRYAPSLALAVWVFLSIGPTLEATSDVQDWYRLNSIWARYLMAFPGALLAAYGLRKQGGRLIAPMHVPHILHTLRVASTALVAYAVVGGLAVPPGGFFPANWLNSGQVQRLTVLPVEHYRSACGLALAVAMIRVHDVFEQELDRRLARMETSQVLASERERIGQELHDGTMQTIYAAGLLLRAADKEIKAAELPRIDTLLRESIGLLDRAVADIRHHIGMLRAPIGTDSLVAGLEELVGTRRLRSLVQVEFVHDLPEHVSLDPATVAQVLAIAGEALSNVVRHSGASQVRLAANVVGDRLRLVIRDNGNGLPDDLVPGFGLRNMRDRARLLGGELAIETEPRHSTTVTVELPWTRATDAPTPADS